MANLTVRNLDADVVRRLHEEALREGISTAEAHRRLLRRALIGDAPATKTSFKDYLLGIPEAADDDTDAFERQRDEPRSVEF